MKLKEYAKNLLIFLSLIAVPAYTLIFGLQQNPIQFTLSKIGNYFGHRTGFIIWGAISGLLLVGCIFHIFKSTDYKGRFGEKFLVMSYLFLIITVLVPNFRGTIFFHIHRISSVLFAASLLMSILFYMAHLRANHKRIFDKCSRLLLICVGIPVLMLLAFGGLTGLAEIAFFFSICLFLFVLNSVLMREGKNRQTVVAV
jgi:hypothetical protein